MQRFNIKDLVEIIDQQGYPTNLEALGERKTEFHQAVLAKKGGRESYVLAAKAGDEELKQMAVEHLFSDSVPTFYFEIHNLSLKFKDKELQERVEEESLKYDPWRAYLIASHNKVEPFLDKAKDILLTKYGVDVLFDIKRAKDVRFLKEFIERFKDTEKEVCYSVAKSLKGEEFDRGLILEIAKSWAEMEPIKALRKMGEWYEKDLIIETALKVVEAEPSMVYHIGAEKRGHDGYQVLMDTARPLVLAENDPENLYFCGRSGSDKQMLWQAQGRLEQPYDEWNIAYILDDDEAMREPGYRMIESNADRAWWVANHLSDDDLRDAIRESQMRDPEKALKFANERRDDILKERAQEAINKEKGLDQSIMDRLYSA